MATDGHDGEGAQLWDLRGLVSALAASGRLRMSEVSVGALDRAYARRLAAGFPARHVFVNHARLNGTRRLFVPKTRLLRAETMARLAALEIELQVEPPYNEMIPEPIYLI